MDRSAIEGKVWTQVRKMVWILVPSQTSSPVRGQVWSQVWHQAKEDHDER